MWEQYDKDRNGYLSKNESKPMVKDILVGLGAGDEFTEEGFMEVFNSMDKDGSGNIEKKEMAAFTK